MSIKFSRANSRYGCLSNFASCRIEYDCLVYHSSEAAWQAQKTLDLEQRKAFTKLSQSDAKKAGRGKLKLFDENGKSLGYVQLRPDWEDIKYQLMVDVCYAKYSQNPEFKDVLLSTEDEELIENTTGWHDNTWGSCECPRCINKEGKNLLGKALMQVRAMLND